MSTGASVWTVTLLLTLPLAAAAQSSDRLTLDLYLELEGVADPPMSMPQTEQFYSALK